MDSIKLAHSFAYGDTTHEKNTINNCTGTYFFFYFRF